MNNNTLKKISIYYSMETLQAKLINKNPQLAPKTAKGYATRVKQICAKNGWINDKNECDVEKLVLYDDVCKSISHLKDNSKRMPINAVAKVLETLGYDEEIIKKYRKLSDELGKITQTNYDKSMKSDKQEKL